MSFLKGIGDAISGAASTLTGAIWGPKVTDLPGNDVPKTSLDARKVEPEKENKKLTEENKKLAEENKKLTEENEELKNQKMSKPQETLVSNDNKKTEELMKKNEELEKQVRELKAQPQQSTAQTTSPPTTEDAPPPPPIMGNAPPPPPPPPPPEGWKPSPPEGWTGRTPTKSTSNKQNTSSNPATQDLAKAAAQRAGTLRKAAPKEEKIELTQQEKDLIGKLNVKQKLYVNGLKTVEEKKNFLAMNEEQRLDAMKKK